MKRMTKGASPMLGLFALLLVSLYLMSDASQNAARFDQLYIGLLLLNSIFLLSLVVIISINIFEFVRQVVAKQPGSRLTMRLVLMFVVLALTPAAIVYAFSVQLLDRGIDSWFDVRVERALQDALDLSRSSLDLQMRRVRRQTETIVQSLRDEPNVTAALTLNDMLRRSGAVEMTLFGEANRIIASSGDITASVIPRLPGDSVLRLVNRGQTYVGLDPLRDSGLHIRIVVPVPATHKNPSARILQVLYPVSERIGVLAASVQEAFGKYNELLYLRTPLKQSFILSLSLVLLLAVLFAVWAAFFSSKRLMAPIGELAEGTKAVAAGQYHKKLPVDKKDDLGMLVASFNRMTERLSEARDAAEDSQRQLESQRAYLETVLEHLSSGVLSLDLDLVLYTVNPAANQILGLSLDQYKGKACDQLGDANPVLVRFFESLEAHLKGPESEWQEQVTLLGRGGRKILICRGARLPPHGDLSGGHVIVFDDVTALIQAQRNAAWAEVARRLAHEIKNPLTPIQLSAERLHKKLLPKLGPTESEVLKRSARTIAQQVESMKMMVNAFSDYARTPKIDISPLNLNRLIEDVVELYRTNVVKAALELNLDHRVPRIEADSSRVRQLLHNLIKNSLEALEGKQEARLKIATQCVQEGGRPYVELILADNGPGFPEELMDRLFEPYVSSKPRGNGLGLAIVKKIVEEHGGSVWAENDAAGGARIRIHLLSVASDAGLADSHLEGDAA